MGEVNVRYGVIFGKCDASDWMEYTVNVSDELSEIYDRDYILRIDPNEDERLADCLSEAYDEIEAEEIKTALDCGEEYVLECMGKGPVDPDEINELVADRDEYTLEFFGLTGMSEEELDEWDANDLEELPIVCDFDKDFEPTSPFASGWELRVEFDEFGYIDEEDAEEALNLLIGEGDFSEVQAYMERAEDYIQDGTIDLEKIAERIAKEKGVYEEYTEYFGEEE